MSEPVTLRSRRKQTTNSIQKSKPLKKGPKTSTKSNKILDVPNTTSELTSKSPDYNDSAENLREKSAVESPTRAGSCKDEEKLLLAGLTDAQKAKIELNRQKALLIRQDKKNKRKLCDKVDKKKESTNKVIRINDIKLLDTGAGFFIEEKNEASEEDMVAAMHIITDPAPLLKEDQPFCKECSQPFNNSFLSHNFGEEVCDECRDDEDKHALITKTDAKNNYLLKDVDFDKREPHLKYIVRKNPHNSQWGDMKLYLKLQVERRALEIWETEEAIEEALKKRESQRELSKQKNYKKKMKELRMNVRSSLYTRATKNHEHEYGEEVYHSDEDEYSKTCSTCGHSYKYDKM